MSNQTECCNVKSGVGRILNRKALKISTIQRVTLPVLLPDQMQFQLRLQRDRRSNRTILIHNPENS